MLHIHSKRCGISLVFKYQWINTTLQMHLVYEQEARVSLYCSPDINYRSPLMNVCMLNMTYYSNLGP